MYHETDEEPIQRILPVLEVDHQHVRHVEAWNQDLIAQIRRCGRAAARQLGYGVRTFQSDPNRPEDGRVVVIVAVTRSAPDEEKRIRERSDLADARGLELPDMTHSQGTEPPDTPGRFTVRCVISRVDSWL